MTLEDRYQAATDQVFEPAQGARELDFSQAITRASAQLEMHDQCSGVATFGLLPSHSCTCNCHEVSAPRYLSCTVCGDLIANQAEAERTGRCWRHRELDFSQAITRACAQLEMHDQCSGVATWGVADEVDHLRFRIRTTWAVRRALNRARAHARKFRRWFAGVWGSSSSDDRAEP